MNIGELHRREYGHMLATLVRAARDLGLAEETLQEAFEAALLQWPVQGAPPNPVGWLMSTARHKIIDQLRRRSFLAQHRAQLVDFTSPEPMPSEADDTPVPYDSLRLIFTCCHPALAAEAQVALSLRTICGLSTEEIARSFVVPVATMAQRLVRAKGKIKQDAIPYEVPEASALPERLDNVLAVIYLVFNEGYSASSGQQVVRADLCSEALRLARELSALLPDQREPRALLALMLLSDARRATRSDAEGWFVPLEDQDRSRWQQTQITEGAQLIATVFGQGPPGWYALQAAVAALHATATSVATTDWAQIAALYGLMMQVRPSPIIELNRAVAVGMAEGFERGLLLLAEIDLPSYHLLPATRADFLRRLGRHAEALSAYQEALSIATSEPDRRFLVRRLGELAQLVE